MKRFSLEEFKKNPNRNIVTRDGKAKARIICTDCKSEYPIIVLLSYSEQSEGCEAYTADGRFSIDGESNSDLFFEPEKREGWVNIYKLNEHYMRAGDLVFPTKEEAMKSISSEDYVATTHIEWEE